MIHETAGPILVIIGNGGDGSIGITPSGKIIRIPPREPLIGKVMAAANTFQASEGLHDHALSRTLRTASEQLFKEALTELTQALR